MSIKLGIAGMGAIGGAVAKAVQDGIDGFEFTAAADSNPDERFNVPYMEFDALAEQCDLVVEALPPNVVPALACEVFKRNKNLVLISSCALFMYPEILEHHKASNSRIIVPSGSLCGLDGVQALAQKEIKSASIASTKPPQNFSGAPFITENNIDLAAITERTCLFSGSVLEAAQGFPANVNVAATLSLACAGHTEPRVEIWADPQAPGNIHEIEVNGEYSRIKTRIENTPDPANPKSSMLAAQSIIAVLKSLNEPLVVL